MRIGIVSDVHCNWPALRAVIEDMEERGVESILSCGDTLGYYPFIAETLALFRRRGIAAVMGNHDQAILTDDYSGMNRLALVSDPWMRAHLPEGAMDWLSALPFKLGVEVEGVAVALYHASPYSITQYVHPADAADLPYLMVDASADVVVLGHTHKPMQVRVGGGLVLNPGSVGQPRDGDPRASYGVLDATAGKPSFTVHRVAYPIDEVRERVERDGLPAMLWERLGEGR